MYCYKHIQSNKIKSIFKNDIILDKKTKCYICERFLIGIVDGPSIIKYIKQNQQNENLLQNISKHSVWYFNGIYDNFGFYLRTKFNLSHQEIKNISQAINDLYALQNINIINEKAKDLYNLIN